MWPLSTAAKTALTQSHAMDVRAVVISPTLGTRVVGIAGGEVVADARSQVRRTATVIADPNLWPASPTDLLAPYGSEMTLERGIVLPGGSTEWVPLGRFALDDTARERPRDDGITVQLVDRSARVAEDRFDAPTQTVSGALTTVEIRRLIQETLGVGVLVTDLTGSSQVAAVLEMQRERWADGVEKLADSIGAEVFFDVLGAGVIRPQPTLDDPVVWEISTGALGTIVTARDRLTREGVYNRVIATGQRSDGTAPVIATVSDLDAASPTRYGGPFGKKPRFYSSPLLTTTPQCTAAATALLERSRGTGARITPTVLVNPALEPGDVIAVRDNGIATAHILDKVVTPLGPTGLQQLETRSNITPEQ